VSLNFFRPYWISLSLEVRKLLTYRVNLLVEFVGEVLSYSVVSYFLWRAVYETTGQAMLGGYTFHQMMAYSVLVPMIYKIVMGPAMHFLSEDVYTGSLSRYLVYPVNYFGIKLSTNLATSFLGCAQTLFFLGVMTLIPALNLGQTVSLSNLLLGLITAILVSPLYFVLECSIEMAAFWAEGVWSLSVMLKLILAILGGGMIPLSFFPEKIQPILEHLPFALMASFPIRTAMGRVDLSEWLYSMLLVLGWTLLALAVQAQIWKRGLKGYSGVGM